MPAPIKRNPKVIFGHTTSEIEKSLLPNSPCNMKASGLISIFLVRELLAKGCVRISIGRLFTVIPFEMHNSLALKDCSLEVVGNVGLLRNESIWTESLMIVGVHLDIVLIECETEFAWVMRTVVNFSISDCSAAPKFSSLFCLFFSFNWEVAEPWL